MQGELCIRSAAHKDIMGIKKAKDPPGVDIAMSQSIIESSPTKERNHTLAFHLLHRSNERAKATILQPALTQKVNCQQRIPSHNPRSAWLAATYEYSKENTGVPRGGESESIPKFRPRFRIPQMDDKIPGLGAEPLDTRRRECRGAHLHDVEDAAVH